MRSKVLMAKTKGFCRMPIVFLQINKSYESAVHVKLLSHFFLMHMLVHSPLPPSKYIEPRIESQEDLYITVRNPNKNIFEILDFN